MTAPVYEKEGLPKWVESLSKKGRFFAPGLAVVFWMLRTASVKESLTSPIFSPPTLLFDIANMSTSVALILCLVVCGPYALEFLKDFIAKKNG